MPHRLALNVLELQRVKSTADGLKEYTITYVRDSGYVVMFLSFLFNFFCYCFHMIIQVSVFDVMKIDKCLFRSFVYAPFSSSSFLFSFLFYQRIHQMARQSRVHKEETPKKEIAKYLPGCCCLLEMTNTSFELDMFCCFFMPVVMLMTKCLNTEL